MEIVYDIAAAVVISSAITWIVVPEFLPEAKNFHSATKWSVGVFAVATMVIAVALNVGL